ncbi:MAG: hypothetical protein EOO52_13265 [Gammaproteobacteria bacterium]|nr:MAG: hypothetical protein EOO52_13265 [Gammaproteobacteria bacterium]
MLAKNTWLPFMPSFDIHYSDSETLPDRINAAAAELSLTPEELIKRVLDEAFPSGDSSPSMPADSLQGFLAANGAVKQ